MRVSRSALHEKRRESILVQMKERKKLGSKCARLRRKSNAAARTEELGGTMILEIAMMAMGEVVSCAGRGRFRSSV